MISNLKALIITHKTTIILLSLLILLVGGGWSLYRNYQVSSQANITEVDLNFDAEGPYALLLPRRDGNALQLNLKRTSSYDEITYELAYTSRVDETTVGGKAPPPTDEGGVSTGTIDRGVVGKIDTSEKKGEYQQEILFGTCSKNVCKYDKGVENGTLTLRIRKGAKAYRMVTTWHLQQPDVVLGNLISGDGHFNYEIKAARADLSLIGHTIINDLTGLPKLPEEKQVLGKVYAVNVPLAKELLPGTLTLELAENPPAEAKIYHFNEGENKWLELDTKISGSKLTTTASGAGIFAVLNTRRVK
ncbi:MAG: hypothetical protein HYW45_00250 [Candidatus Daviesbacteria bacterium]|nr:MAG: hypothetical protein HYW45_00250 [Candidatus Daviesbacteria bacterium]